MAFIIKHVKPMFTGVVTTSKRYVGDMMTAGGLLIDTRRMEGELNPYQTVVSVGPMCQGLKEGDIVKINFKRYFKAKHVPGVIDAEQNTQSDNLQASYEIPVININGQEFLFIQNTDIEYIVDDYDVDAGGLLQ